MKELPQKSNSRKTAEVIATGLASSVPVAGGLLGVALYEALNVSYNQRMQLFLEDLAQKVDGLIDASSSLDISKVTDDPSFQEAIFQATKLPHRQLPNSSVNN